jgi:precorrin-2 methylase
MNQVTAAYVISHAFELDLVIGVLSIVAAFSAVKLALVVGDLAKFVLAKFTQSGPGRRSTSRLDAVGAR